MNREFGEIRLHTMKSWLRELCSKDTTVIDLGAGHVPISQGLSARSITTDILLSCRPDLVANLSGSYLPFKDGSADIVVAGEILEHIYYSKLFLREIWRVLRDEGFLLLSVPNAVSLKYRIAFLLGRIPSNVAKADCFYEDDRPGHVRDFNLYELKHLLVKTNFEVEKVSGDGLSFRGKTIISPIILPITLQDGLVVLAKKSTR